MDESAHGLPVVPFRAAQYDPVARTADHFKMIAGKPIAQGLHVAGNGRLTDAEHLAVVIQLSGFPIPQKFKEQVPSPFIDSGLLHAVVPEPAAELFDILLLPGEHDPFSLVVNKAESVGAYIAFQKAEFPLDGPLADPKLIRDLLFGHGSLSAQQNFQNLLRSQCKISHGIS